MDTAVSAQAPAAGPKTPAKSTTGHMGRNVRYPIQLRVNLTVEMNESLGRVARYLDMPEGMIGRMALKQYLTNQDPQFRQQLQNSFEGNDRTRG